MSVLTTRALSLLFFVMVSYLAEFTSGTAHEREAALAEEQYVVG